MTKKTISDSWRHDHEFTEAKLSRVEKQGDGYALDREKDFGTLFVPDPGWAPLVGQIARFYGKGTGFPVRGVVIEGRAVYYKTRAEHDAEMDAQSEKWKREQAENDARVKAAGRSEAAMRTEDVPWPKTADELSAYIEKQVTGPHDYGTCVYAASLSATAAFHYVCSVLGMTGFQASCADLDVLRRTRHIDGPFIVMQAADLLYPQYNLRDKLDTFIGESRAWAKAEAEKKLADTTNGNAHPDVRRHWEELAGVK